jgi:hypothetical protein
MIMNRLLPWLALAPLLVLLCLPAALMLLSCNRDYFRGLNEEWKAVREGGLSW